MLEFASIRKTANWFTLFGLLVDGSITEEAVIAQAGSTVDRDANEAKNNVEESLVCDLA